MFDCSVDFLFSKVISVNEVNSLLIYDDLCD